MSPCLVALSVCAGVPVGLDPAYTFTVTVAESPTALPALPAKLAVALEGLRRRQVEPVQACWVFEHARLLLAQRADGTTLALFVENRPGQDFSRHQAAVAAFGTLPTD